MHSVRGASILVTGGCGFIGSHLIQQLWKRGARSVRIIDSLRFGDSTRLGAFGEQTRIIPYTLGYDDPESLIELLADTDYVFHLAAEKHNQSINDPVRVLRSNVEGTFSLLHAASKSGVRKLVFSSSLYAYGRMQMPPMVESEKPEPCTVYGISKLAGEHLHHFAWKEWQLSYNIVRLFFIYGPGQFAGSGYKSVIVANFERILAGKSPVVYGDGQQVLDYLYVSDAVDALILALETDIEKETFNVGSGMPISVNDLVHKMIRVAGKSFDVSQGPPDWTAGSSRVSDITKIQNVLGWSPSVPLEEGLQKTFDSLKVYRG